MTPAAFRRLARAQPGAVEGEHHDHPDFRANGRVFASLHPDGLRAMVKVAPPRQRELLQQAPLVYAPASGAWGRAGCTMVVLAAADPDHVAAALHDAWLLAMAAKPGRRR